LLNSKLFFFSIKRFYGGGGLGETGVRMKHTFFENFLLPDVNNDVSVALISRLDLILELKEREENTSIIEDEIDQIYYNLYALNNEEITFIKSQ
jgi:adenine-specific DNA-methyltransferase